MSDIDVHHLAAAYALDALDQRERAAFEAHYERCDVCRADVLEFRGTMAEVAGALSTPPPPSLKDRVMADIAVTRQLSPSLVAPVPAPTGRSRGSWAMLAAAAAVIIALVVGVVAFNGGNDVFVDVGNKSLGLDARMRYLGCYPHETLHVGDRFTDSGNDTATRDCCSIVWVANPD